MKPIECLIWGFLTTLNYCEEIRWRKQNILVLATLEDGVIHDFANRLLNNFYEIDVDSSRREQKNSTILLSH